MANGTIVATRVTNGTVRVGDRTIDVDSLPYDRCFVLIKHLVHTRQDPNPDRRERIDYGQDSTSIIYSLYMHLKPLSISRDEENNSFVLDYDSLPVWVNHYLIDHPNHTDITSGEIIFPNYPITLGDELGSTGDYITRVHGPVYGKTLHLEVFTTVDPSTFSGSPWAQAGNRKEDVDNNVVCNLDLLDGWIRDISNDGLDTADIKGSAANLRNKTVKHKSEWSATSKTEYADEVSIGGNRQQIGNVLSDENWNKYFLPLCFHPEMIRRFNEVHGRSIMAADDQPIVSTETEEERLRRLGIEMIGPFFNENLVWHLHPFEFLRWMNGSVDKHEQILAEQVKPITRHFSEQSNIVVENSYVVGFQNQAAPNTNQLPQSPNRGGYKEACHDNNIFEITVDKLADQVELSQAPQDYTRFHFCLLEIIDMINDETSQKCALTEGYVRGHRVSKCSESSFHTLHRGGRAMDVMMAIGGTTVIKWFRFYNNAREAVDYIRERDGHSLELRMVTHDEGAGLDSDELERNAELLLQRINAANEADSNRAAVQTLRQGPRIQHLDHMRLHIGFTR
jgi:hypothetical protein